MSSGSSRAATTVDTPAALSLATSPAESVLPLAKLIPPERQREMIASDYYFGGMYARRSGHLHPALYYKGLLEAAHRAGATLCANVEAERIEKKSGGWRVLTAKGPVECREVVIWQTGQLSIEPTCEALP